MIDNFFCKVFDLHNSCYQMEGKGEVFDVEVIEVTLVDMMV